MKKIALITALLVMSASPAVALEWKYLGVNGTSDYFYYSPKTFTAKDKIVSSWVRKEFKVDAEVMTKDKRALELYTGSSSILAFEEFDCAKKTKRTLTGKVRDAVKGAEDLNRVDWAEVVPGSIDESLLNALCQAGEKKEISVTPQK